MKDKTPDSEHKRLTNVPSGNITTGAQRVKSVSTIEMGDNNVAHDPDLDENFAGKENSSTTSIYKKTEAKDADKDAEAEEEDEEDEEESYYFSNDEPYIDRLKDVFWSFLPLGLLAFGGPTAHIAILHERFVVNKKWLSNERFIELLAVGQGLPGPTSTQMVISCGAFRGGLLGGILSFLCWNIPSFIILTLSGLGISNFINGEPDWMSGLAPAAVSLVFVAAFKLSKKVINSNIKIILCLISSIIVLIINGDKRISARTIAIIYPILIFGGGLITLIDSKIKSRAHIYDDLRSGNNGNSKYKFTINIEISRKSSLVLFILWLFLLSFFIIGRSDGLFDSNSNSNGNDNEKYEIWKLFESFFRIGSIIYGGGQVVLPMLLTEVVDPGWVTEHQFWQGFAIVQALPGPLFNFSAYLGCVGFGLQGAFIGWLGLFGPGLLLIFSFLPLWAYVHKWEWFRIFLQGVNATAIGLVIAACEMLWVSAVDNFADASVALLTATLVLLGIPAPAAIIVGAIVGFLFSPTVFGIGLDDVCDSSSNSNELDENMYNMTNLTNSTVY